MCEPEVQTYIFQQKLQMRQSKPAQFPPFEVRGTVFLKFIYPFGMFNLFLRSYRHCWEFGCFGGNCSCASKRCSTPIHCATEVTNLFGVVFKYSSSTLLSTPADTFLVDCCYQHSWLKGSTLLGGTQSPIKDALTCSCFNNKVRKQFYLFLCSKHR